MKELSLVSDRYQRISGEKGEYSLLFIISTG